MWEVSGLCCPVSNRVHQHDPFPAGCPVGASQGRHAAHDDTQLAVIYTGMTMASNPTEAEGCRPSPVDKCGSERQVPGWIRNECMYASYPISCCPLVMPHALLHQGGCGPFRHRGLRWCVSRPGLCCKHTQARCLAYSVTERSAGMAFVSARRSCSNLSTLL
jgi:hypothetical protein